jgi:hypothetical protein
MASLVQLPRARRWASQHGHLARRVRIRPLGIIRSAGAQNSGGEKCYLFSSRNQKTVDRSDLIV